MSEPMEPADNGALKELRRNRLYISLAFGVCGFIAGLVVTQLFESTPNTGMIIAATASAAWYAYGRGVRDVIKKWKEHDDLGKTLDNNPDPPE